jgi:hypothetical protein
MASRNDRFKLPVLNPSAERRLDAEEVIRWVLPNCQIRPYVYNQIAKLAERLQNEADEMALTEAKAAGEEYKPLKRTHFVMYMPVNSPNLPIADRKLDLALVTDLVSVKRRSMVILMLNSIRMRMQQQIKSMEADQQASARRETEERSLMLQTYISVLPRLRDRPSLVSQVGAHIAMLVDGDADKYMGAAPEEERARSSRDYWEDVQRLDEIIDTLADGSFAKAAFGTMKMSAVAEARALQKIEVEQSRAFTLRQIGSFEEIRLSI